MSAETLRRAAADINAEWRNDDHTSDGRCKYPKSCLIDERHQKFASGAVALAVADWLESTANDVEHVHTPVYNLTSTTVARALAVARAYLGSDS